VPNSQNSQPNLYPIPKGASLDEAAPTGPLSCVIHSFLHSFTGLTSYGVTPTRARSHYARGQRVWFLQALKDRGINRIRSPYQRPMSLGSTSVRGFALTPRWTNKGEPRKRNTARKRWLRARCGHWDGKNWGAWAVLWLFGFRST